MRILIATIPGILATFLLLLGGCTGTAAPDAVVKSAANSVNEGVLGWQSTQDQVVELATAGPVSVDLELLAGDVTIVAKPNLASSTVQVRRVGTHGWGRDDESMKSLSDIHYTVTLKREGGSDTIVVRANSDTDEPHFQQVNVEIAVPDLDAVRVRTRRGEIWVENNRGPVDVVTSRAKIRVMTPWKITSPISLVTSDGEVDLRLRGESTGLVDADTVGGNVNSRIKYGKWIAIERRNDADSFRAALNDGTNPIVLRTSNADIWLSVVAEPVSQNPFPPM